MDLHVKKVVCLLVSMSNHSEMTQDPLRDEQDPLGDETGSSWR